MAIIQTTTAWGMPIWIDQSTGEQVSDPFAASYTAPEQGNAFGNVAGKFLFGGYEDGQLQDNSAWNNPDGSVTWLSGGKPQVLSQADWDKEMARQVAADRGPLGALMEIGTQFVLPAFGAYSLASNFGGLLGGEGATSGLGYENAFDSGAMNSAMNGSTAASTAGNLNFAPDYGLKSPFQSEGLKLGVPDLNYMGAGGTGVQGTIEGLGTLGKDGVISAANLINGGTQAIMPGSTVGNLTTNLAFDPMNLPTASTGLSLTPKQIADMAKAATGLLGSSAPTPTQSSPMGGGSSGYSANIQPDMGLLSLNKPQYANIFQTQQLQPIYGSQRGY